MQISSNSPYITKDYTQSNCAMETSRHNMATRNNASLHNKVAKFVLDLQSDVTLEDLLDNVDSNKPVMQPTSQQRKYQTIDLNNEHSKALKQLYDEIKHRQSGLINRHDTPAKRSSTEDHMVIGKSKALRNSETCLLDTLDGIDDNWLMNFASQMGLDENIELPELKNELIMW